MNFSYPYVNFWHFYNLCSLNMAMSRDPRSKFRKNFLFPNSAFNIRKSYKISSRKTLYFKSYQPKNLTGGGGGGKHPPPSAFRVNDKNEIVTAMIEHMAQQIENPALRNSKFVFDRILQMDIDFHRLNLTRDSSYILLPDWLMKKKAIINPRNSDMECFK